MMTHTSGPWTWDEGELYSHIDDPKCKQVVLRVSYGRVVVVDKNDAPVLAAAPDLLAACEAVINPKISQRATTLMILEAIAKAKGAA